MWVCWTYLHVSFANENVREPTTIIVWVHCFWTRQRNILAMHSFEHNNLMHHIGYFQKIEGIGVKSARERSKCTPMKFYPELDSIKDVFFLVTWHLNSFLVLLRLDRALCIIINWQHPWAWDGTNGTCFLTGLFDWFYWRGWSNDGTWRNDGYWWCWRI